MKKSTMYPSGISSHIENSSKLHHVILRTIWLWLSIGSCSLFAQFPATSVVFESGVDGNHYSIETSELDDTYVIAGTKFDGPDRYIHLYKLDEPGNMVWERHIQLSTDDRALDVCVHPTTGDIVLVGYTSWAGYPQAFMAKFDIGGGLISQRILDILPIPGTNYPCAATNVIFSSSSNTFLVGGFWSDNFAVPLGITHNYSYIFSIDPSLNTINWSTHLTGNLEKHNSINDIVEMGGNQVFVTGSAGTVLSFPGVQQSVLALTIDLFSGAIINDISFHKTNYSHIGVSAVYDPMADRIMLLTNSSADHNPSLYKINNVSTAPSIVGGVVLAMSSPSRDAAGFDLMRHPHAVNRMIVSGYYRFSGVPGSNDTHMWVAEIKTNGTPLSAYEWNVPANNFALHGDQIFSTFNWEHPYIFNQEILSHNVDPGSSFPVVALAPNNFLGSYGVELVPAPGTGNCLFPISFTTSPVNYYSVSIIGSAGIFPAITPISVMTTKFSSHIQYCGVHPRSLVVESEDNAVEQTVEISPNPTTGRAEISLGGEQLEGYIRLTDMSGKMVHKSEIKDPKYHKEEINLESYPPGLYIINYSDKGCAYTKKLVKF